MIRSDHLDDDGLRLVAMFPTRFFLTAEGAMASSSMEISGSSSVYVMPSGVFTWTDGNGQWIHPEYGTLHWLSEFHEGPCDEDDDPLDDAPVPTEVVSRSTNDDPFSDDNFGPWELVGGNTVETTYVSATPTGLSA